MGHPCHRDLHAPPKARAVEHLPRPWESACNESHEIDSGVLDRVMAFCRACRGTLPAKDVQLTWEKFFWTYSPYVRRVVRSSGIKGNDVEDCAQEVWLEIVRQLAAGNYDPRRGQFSCWIFTIARNKAIDCARAHGRNRAVDCADLDFLPSRRELDPAVMFERKRRSSLLHLALYELFQRTSSATFEALYQVSIEEKDFPHVAERLGLTVNQVRYRKRRAKQSLRAIFADRRAWGELFDPDGQ